MHDKDWEEAVASRAEDFAFLEKKGYRPWLDDNGARFTVGFEDESLWPMPGHISALFNEITEETRSDEGRQLLVEAYSLYNGLGELEEEFAG